MRGLVDAVLGRDGARVVRPIDEGGEHSSWWIGTDQVLRLARDEDTSRRQRRELALRDLVRPFVGVALPMSVAAGEWADGLAFTVDTRLRGVSAELRTLSRRGELDLAETMAGLRNLPPADAIALGLPVTEPRSMAELRASAAAAAARLTADGEFDGAPLRGPSADPASRVVLHNDLKGEHLLVGSGGRLRGVLDWTDAVIGDPAEDIAGIVIAVGAAAAVRVAAAAGYGPEAWARGVALARHDTLIRLGRPPLRHRRQSASIAARPTRPRLATIRTGPPTRGDLDLDLARARHTRRTHRSRTPRGRPSTPRASSYGSAAVPPLSTSRRVHRTGPFGVVISWPGNDWTG
ncbi:aminoglycoside phosphotransferase family protein [Embleya sp. NPDC001921]